MPRLSEQPIDCVLPAEFAGRAVPVRSTASEIRIVADGAVIAEHVRRFGRDQLICDPWHYLPILERKPGALRNGVPFREWELPIAIQLVRDHILKQPKGDRAFVELMVTEVLEDLGHTTIEAADGPAALEVLRSNTRIDLLITDVGLPGGLNGRQVADIGCAVRAGLHVLFITGYAENAVPNHGHLAPGMQILTKPFSMDALASRVRDLISRT